MIVLGEGYVPFAHYFVGFIMPIYSAPESAFLAAERICAYIKAHPGELVFCTPADGRPTMRVINARVEGGKLECQGIFLSWFHVLEVWVN